jgi:26S proteasome regulatory subunit N5
VLDCFLEACVTPCILQATIPESVTIANEKGIDEAIVMLLALEKKCRLANDSENLREVCLHMVRLCRERSNWVKLNAVLAVINKRDSLNKGVIVAVVKETLSYIDPTPTVEVRIELIKAIKEVCEGKIFVEAESAALSFMLSKIYEEQGDINAASDIIQDVHVETYGSLSKHEKAEYILEQMRVTLVKKVNQIQRGP